MRLDIGPLEAIDWAQVPATKYAGETGVATWRTVQKSDVRIRIVEYSAGYLADHWCEKGHVIHVMKGELITELRDGTTFSLREGMSYTVGDKEGAHRSRTATGATLFIVD